MPIPERILASALPRELLAAHPGASLPVSYRKLVQMMVEGQLPAEQVNTRWTVLRSDLRMIAEKIGLTPAASVAPARRRAKAQPGTERAAA